MTQTDYDIVIAGGGIVGCAAALALSNATSYSIAVIEAFEPKQSMHPSFDARVVALAKESYKQLTQFGIDMDDGMLNCCPIKHIHVSDRGHLGQVQLHSKDLHDHNQRNHHNRHNQSNHHNQRTHNHQQPFDHSVESSANTDNIKHHSTSDSLGYVVALATLGEKMMAQLKLSRVDYFCPEKIVSVERSQDKTQLQLLNNSISAKLVLIAEGGQAPSRELFGLSTSVQDYAQSAMIANVITQAPHRNRAFERFTSQGPIALLPMQTNAGNQMSLVWSIEHNKADAVMAMNDGDFLRKLQQLFGDKLGRFEAASTRYCYPLSLVQVERFTAHRVICLGNAAQSLHPIAGQGFNLGIRDVKGLIDVFSVFSDENLGDPGAFAVINAYRKNRAQDKNKVIGATDALVSIFSNQYLPFTLARNVSLIALNHSPKLKNTLASFAMGER